jgi:hypothetical protein
MPPGVLRSLAIGLFSCPNETGMTDEHTPKQAIMRLPQTNVQKFLGQPTSLEAAKGSTQRWSIALMLAFLSSAAMVGGEQTADGL